jgi:hypothetical protein
LGRDISGTTFFRTEIYRGRLLTFITGSSSRLLHIRFSADLVMYWFPVYHFQCMKFKPLVIWIWNQNIAISTIVGTSSHIRLSQKRGQIGGPKPKLSVVFKGFYPKRGPSSPHPPVDCSPSPVLYNTVLDVSIS